MAGDAQVEESAMLTSRSTGIEREVDVVIRSTVARHEVIVSIEAVAHARKASIEWVERMAAKHSELPTSQLVLVSESGFTASARVEAETRGIVVLAPEDLAVSEPAEWLLASLTELHPKEIVLSERQAQLLVRTEAGTTRRVVAPMSSPLCREGGEERGTIADVLVSWAESGKLGDLLDYMKGLEPDSERSFLIDFGDLVVVEDDDEYRLCLRIPDQDAPAPIIKGRFQGDMVMRAGTIDLKHQKLGEVSFAYGEGMVGSKKALAVVTANNRITVRMSEERPLKQASKIGRNDPCPCGSGRKYKHCHGRSL